MYLGEIPLVVGAPSTPTPSWVTALMDIGKGAMALKQQSDVQKINVQRMQQGLAPIEAGDMATGVKVGVDPKQLNKILMFSGIALGAVLLVVMLRRK